MPNTKRTLGGSATVDGEEYVWRLHQEPRSASASTPGGMVIALRQVGGDREALVEWPIAAPVTDSAGPRRRPNIDPTVLTISVRSALIGGWNPNSRGRPVPILVSRTEAAAFG